MSDRNQKEESGSSADVSSSPESASPRKETREEYLARQKNLVRTIRSEADELKQLITKREEYIEWNEKRDPEGVDRARKQNARYKSLIAGKEEKISGIEKNIAKAQPKRKTGARSGMKRRTKENGSGRGRGALSAESIDRFSRMNDSELETRFRKRFLEAEAIKSGGNGDEKKMFLGPIMKELEMVGPMLEARLRARGGDWKRYRKWLGDLPAGDDASEREYPGLKRGDSPVPFDVSIGSAEEDLDSPETSVFDSSEEGYRIIGKDDLSGEPRDIIDAESDAVEGSEDEQGERKRDDGKGRKQESKADAGKSSSAEDPSKKTRKKDPKTPRDAKGGETSVSETARAAQRRISELGKLNKMRNPETIRQYRQNFEENRDSLSGVEERLIVQRQAVKELKERYGEDPEEVKEAEMLLGVAEINRDSVREALSSQRDDLSALYFDDVLEFLKNEKSREVSEETNGEKYDKASSMERFVSLLERKVREQEEIVEGKRSERDEAKKSLEVSDAKWSEALSKIDRQFFSERVDLIRRKDEEQRNDKQLIEAFETEEEKLLFLRWSLEDVRREYETVRDSGNRESEEEPPKGISDFSSFKTSKGSEYVVLEDGRVQRIKNALDNPDYIGEEQFDNKVKEPSDVTLFYDPANKAVASFFADFQAIDPRTDKPMTQAIDLGVYVGNRDSGYRLLRNGSELSSGDFVFVCVRKDDTFVLRDALKYDELRAFQERTLLPENKGLGIVFPGGTGVITNIPTFGFNVVGYRYNEDGTLCSIHSGHEVVEITRKEEARVNEEGQNNAELGPVLKQMYDILKKYGLDREKNPDFFGRSTLEYSNFLYDNINVLSNVREESKAFGKFFFALIGYLVAQGMEDKVRSLSKPDAKTTMGDYLETLATWMSESSVDFSGFSPGYVSDVKFRSMISEANS